MRALAFRVPGLLAVGFALGSCSGGQPIDDYLPALPPAGGAKVARAGLLTEANFPTERVPGPASLGLVGDYFMANDRIRVVVQAPGRAIGACPFGGNIIDLDFVEQPAGDQIGEVTPFLQLGRTINFTRGEVVRDGRQGGPAVLRFYGHDAMDDFIDIIGLGSFALAIGADYRSDIDLELEAAVTYILMPGEAKVRVIYTFYNPNSSDRQTLWGTLNDSGANVKLFHEGTGFGELGFDAILGGSNADPIQYVAIAGSHIAYGIVPIFEDKSISGTAVPVSGIDVEAYDVKQTIDALGPNGQTLSIPAGKGATREIQVLAERDVAGVTAAAHVARGEGDELVPVRGTAGAPGALVSVTRPAVGAGPASAVTVFVADEAGAFSGSLMPGSYVFQAQADGWRRGAAVSATVPGGDVALSVPAAGQLGYTIRDPSGQKIPGKVVVIGSPAGVPVARFEDTTKDPLPYGVAGFRASLEGDSAALNGFDRPIPLVPGRYRVAISRGPEWSLYEQVIDLTAAGAQIDAVLYQVSSTPGYIAADFHQHTNMSPDAPADPADRIVTNLADGVEFVASTDHDVHFDYAPVIKALGADRLLASVVGVETTPWAYGHFIAFPMVVDPLSPNGGAFDWAGGELGLNLPPSEIFAGLRAQGAQIIEVNHPRVPADAFTSFQAHFDRAGLRFDFAGRSFFGDASVAPMSPVLLGLPEGAKVFSDKFDTLEVYNGFEVVTTATGERLDVKTDLVVRDWMNFLSFGFNPVAVGNSDTHVWLSAPAGVPHTWVHVPDDGPSALIGGLTDAVVATLGRKGATPGDAIVSNGPFLSLTVDGAGIGSTVSHPSGPLSIRLELRTPPWAPVDTLEILSNETFEIPVPRGGTIAEIKPAICLSSRATPTSRCQAAIGGARPLVLQTVETVPGVAASARLEAVVTISDVDVAQLVARQRTGGNGSSDVWLVARALGSDGLFPVIPVGVSPAVSADQLVSDRAAAVAGTGVPAFAMTNAIFVDADGNGYRAPFAP